MVRLNCTILNLEKNIVHTSWKIRKSQLAGSVTPYDRKTDQLVSVTHAKCIGRIKADDLAKKENFLLSYILESSSTAKSDIII